jgi:hypothetical protein
VTFCSGEAKWRPITIGHTSNNRNLEANCIFFNCSVGVAFLIDSLHNLCNDLTVSSSYFNQDPNTGTTLHKYFILSKQLNHYRDCVDYLSKMQHQQNS